MAGPLPLEERGTEVSAVQALVLAALPQVHRFAQMVSPPGADPDDLAQQAALRALEAAHQFDPQRGSIDGWLWAIVVNVARGSGRTMRRRDALFHRLVARQRETGVAASPEALALARIDDEELLAAVRRLPRRYRTLIALRFGAGLGWEEVAALLGISRVAAAKATRRGLDRLRADLAGRREDAT